MLSLLAAISLGSLAAFADVPVADTGKREQAIASLILAGREREALLLRSLANRTDLHVNIGGEGELAGYINVNPLLGVSPEARERIIARTSTSGLLEFGGQDLPFDDKSVTKLVAMNLPSPVYIQQSVTIAREVKRVLALGGTARLICRTPVFLGSVGAMLKQEGFVINAAGNEAKYHAPQALGAPVPNVGAIGQAGGSCAF